MPYEGPLLARLRTILESGARHTIKRRDQREPHVQYVFSDTQVREMHQALEQLEEKAHAPPQPNLW